MLLRHHMRMPHMMLQQPQMKLEFRVGLAVSGCGCSRPGS